MVIQKYEKKMKEALRAPEKNAGRTGGSAPRAVRNAPRMDFKKIPYGIHLNFI